MSDPNTPVAGWYDDPDIALRLRWWDGARWTHHTRPKQVLARASVAVAPSIADPADARAAQVPYGMSAPASLSPTSPGSADGHIATAAGIDSPPSVSYPLGTFGSSARSAHALWNSASQALDYAPERTTGFSAWAIAATPLVATLAGAAATLLIGFESTPFVWVVAAGALPILWMIAFVLRDRARLHDWGHLQLASAWWALLGPVGYLSARAIVVNRQARGHGWWPLAVNLAVTAGLVSLGLFRPTLFLVFATSFM